MVFFFPILNKKNLKLEEVEQLVLEPMLGSLEPRRRPGLPESRWNAT